MRVLQVINAVAAERGGPSNVVTQLSLALAALGVEVEVVSTRADLDRSGEAAARAALGTVPLHLAQTHGPRRLEVSPGFIPLLRSRLRGAQLVHVHTVFTAPVAIAPLICRAHRTPYVLRPAGTLDATCLALGHARQKRLAVAAYVRPNLISAAAVHATSAAEADELQRLAPTARVRIVEPGVESPERSAPDAGGQGRRVGFLGRLHPIKRLEVLIRALALLPERVELLVAGEGDSDYVDSLKLLARSLSLQDRIVWLGHLAPPAKQAFLAEVDLLACPSAHESFGVAVAEAMAAGRAVIVAPSVALAAVVATEGAGVVAAADPASFARALTQLLEDGAGRARLAAAAREVAATRWRWDLAARRTLALYEEALARQAAPRS